MSGRASAGQVKELALGVGHGVPADISAEDAERNLADMSQIHLWLQLGLSVDLGQVDVAAVKAVIQPKILEQVTTVTVPAIPVFDAGARFRVTPEKERESVEVPIGWMSDNARKLVQDQTEPEVGETALRIHKLLRASVDGPIIAELGGEEVATTTWGQMYEMMRHQGRGQEGNLLTNGWANIFYIPADGAVWAVGCLWNSGGGYWGVSAVPVARPGTWDAGRRVVSR